MSTPATDEDKLNFPGMTARVKYYLSLIAWFPFQWGLPDQTQPGPSSRPRLFRYDARRLRGMVVRAEHMLRCLIIWLAHRKMRDETITPIHQVIPVPTGKPPTPIAPIHPDFALRGLPVYPPKPPAFRISLPEPAANKTSPRKSSGDRWLRPRNDDTGTPEALYLRLERLDQLFDSVEARATRLAARWAGDIAARQKTTSPPHSAPPTIRPLKTSYAPDELLFGAAEDETEDINILHDVAFRAAEGFPALCG